MSDTTSPAATKRIPVQLLLSNNPAVNPGVQPFKVEVKPDLGIVPAIALTGPAGIAHPVLDSTQSAPAIYSGMIVAQAVGQTSCLVTLDGAEIVAFDVSVGLLTEGASVTLDPVIMPTLPPAPAKPQPAPPAPASA